MSDTVDGDEDNFPTSFDVPADGDGPGINAVDVNVGFEALADRTVWLKKRRVVVYADVAAMTAVAAPSDGALATVRRKGLFVFKLADGTADDLPFVARDDGNTGAWFNVALDTLDVAKGIPRLDADARVPIIRIPNAIIGTYFSELVEGTASVTNDSGSYIDIPTATLVIPDVQEGDIIEYEISGIVETSLSSTVQYRARAVVGFASATYPTADLSIATSNEIASIPYTLIAQYVVTSDDYGTGSVTIQVQGRTGGGGTDSYVRARSIRARLIRP